MLELGVIGAGNMGAAISRGILRQELYRPSQMMIFDVNPEQVKPFKVTGVQIASSEKQVVEQCRFVLLAVKPQSYREVLQAIAPSCHPDNVFISIAAGVSGDFIKRELGYDAKVILVMPNTPILLGHGASALARIEPTSNEEFQSALALFAASGAAVEVPPDQMCSVIPVHGSSPAMFYHIAQIFVRQAAAHGIDPDVANRLICQSMTGSAAMMLEAGGNHQELIDMVSSKGGTTLAMRAAMDAHGFEDALINGFEACIRRAEELGQ